MKPRFVSVLVLLILLFGCSKKEMTAPIQSSPTITASEYVVLAALMDSLLGESTISTIVLDDSTQPGTFGSPIDSALIQMLERVGQHLPGLKQETVSDFIGKNLRRTYIDDPKRIHPACVRSSETDVTFPWCGVSRVGFSSDGGQALVYVGIVWAPLAGAGEYYMLSRNQGVWVISGSVMIWIS